MTSIDPFAHRVKALEAAASPQFATAGLIHAVVYLGDQLARLNDLADTVASGPLRTGNDGAPLGEVVHDEAAELVPSTVVDAVLTAADLDALPDRATVYDADGDGWTKTGNLWRLDDDRTAAASGQAHAVRAATVVRVYGPITATN